MLRPQVLVTCIDVPVDAGPEVWQFSHFCYWVRVLCVSKTRLVRSLAFLPGCECLLAATSERFPWVDVSRSSASTWPCRVLWLCKALGTIFARGNQGWYLVHSGSLQCVAGLLLGAMNFEGAKGRKESTVLKGRKNGQTKLNVKEENDTSL